jgi:hypothetical protein
MADRPRSPSGRNADRYDSEIREGELYEDRKQKIRLSAYQTLGWRIFLVIVVLAVLMTASLVAWAILTYPSIGDVAQLAGQQSTGEDRLQLWREAKAEWVQQLISVAQMALFGSLIPLLGTIAGYLLGQRSANEEESVEI